MPKYLLDQLKKKLSDPGWRTITGNKPHPHEGKLGELVEAAHARYKSGQPAGHLQEIETKFEVDMLQLEELWQHMGLPTI
jgi:hypothetical protein